MKIYLFENQVVGSIIWIKDEKKAQEHLGHIQTHAIHQHKMTTFEVGDMKEILVGPPPKRENGL